MIEPDHPQISIARQCARVGLARSSCYSWSQGESAENRHVMRWLDEQYTQTPDDGRRRMTAWLRSPGSQVNQKRVVRWLHPMGLETVSPKPRLSPPHPTQRVSPDRLRGVPITRVHQGWSTDIPDSRFHGGLVDLVAVMDWFSRSVLSWALSITMDVHVCLEALEQALGVATPDIFHSDQGAQLTRLEFTGR